MKRLLFERKIVGSNAILIFSSLTLVFAIVGYIGGDLMELSTIGFEVIFPFMTAIGVGEWGKTRSDMNFDMIAAQSKSLFKWVLSRSTVVFTTASLFALVSMALVFLTRNEMPLWEMVWLYVPSALFLSTLCALCSICISAEHIATLICGIFWILSMLARSLLRIPGVQFVYLFIRYAGDTNGIWLINKAVLMLISLGMWMVIYVLCKKRVFIK